MAYEVYDKWTNTWNPGTPGQQAGFAAQGIQTRGSDNNATAAQVQSAANWAKSTYTNNPNAENTRVAQAYNIPVSQPVQQPQPVQQAQQPVQQTANIGLRDYFEGKGVQVGWNPDTKKVSLGGIFFGPEQFGLQNIDGRYVGTQDQINNVTNYFKNYLPQLGGSMPQAQPVQQPQQVELRQSLESRGFNVGYDPNTKRVLINNTPINAEQFGLQNINGRYTGTQSQIDQLLNSYNQQRQSIPNPNASNVGLRQYFEALGKKVDWDASTGKVGINGIFFDPSAFGLQNVNGTFVGSASQIDNIRNYFENNVWNRQPQQQAPAVQPSAPAVQQTPINQVEGSYTNNLGAQIPMNQLNINPNQAEIDRLQKQADIISGDYNSRINNLLQSIETFKPQYQEQIVNILKQSYGTPYDATQVVNTPEYKIAADALVKRVNQEMSARGLYGSTVATDRIQKGLQELIPQIEARQYARYNENLANQLKYADALNTLDKNAYDQYATNVDVILKKVGIVENMKTKDLELVKNNLGTLFDVAKNDYDSAVKQLDIQKTQLQNAIDRIDMRGYVDNKDSIITGLKVGTLSKFAQQEAAKLKSELEVQATKLENDKQLEAVKFQTLKQELDYRSQIKQQEEAQKNTKIENVGRVGMTIQNMTAAQALSYIEQNQQAIAESTGEYMKDLVEMIRLKSVQEEKDKQEQTKINADIQYKQGQLKNEQARIAQSAANQAAQLAQQRELEQARLAQAKQIADDKLKQDDPKAEANQVKEYSKYIEDVYFSTEKDTEGKSTGRRVMSVQDKNDIKAYITNLYNNGISETVVNKLATKYNIE